MAFAQFPVCRIGEARDPVIRHNKAAVRTGDRIRNQGRVVRGQSGLKCLVFIEQFDEILGRFKMKKGVEFIDKKEG